ncbi:hypothetical protein DPMN_181933 [Dreissena polymorpha]|uniref:Uncharacterized protein n=1 Tax=Dreissena polymorpha TaxID=45954 RepID=A0A9D4I246_DREPO|nr:hypothetical protein DPMN_181933 [Dreissena polymorpha]
MALINWNIWVVVNFSQSITSIPSQSSSSSSLCTKTLIATRVSTWKTALPPDGHTILTKFHEDWTINVIPKVLTRFYYSHIMKTAPPPGGHVFQWAGTIFKLSRVQMKTSLPSGNHNQCSDQFTCRLDHHVTSKVKTSPPPPCRPSIIRTNVLTNLHADWTINVTTRVLTRKTSQPPWRPCFQPFKTIFKLS